MISRFPISAWGYQVIPDDVGHGALVAGEGGSTGPRTPPAPRDGSRPPQDVSE